MNPETAPTEVGELQDWNQDGTFTTDDLLYAFQQGNDALQPGGDSAQRPRSAGR